MKHLEFVIVGLNCDSEVIQPHPFSAVQHERKPMTEKRDFPQSVGMNNSSSNFPMNPANKIFIRKDLAMDSKSPVLPRTFSLSDLGLMSSKSAG